MRWGRRKVRTATPNSSDHTTSRAIKKKKLSQMSNEELAALTKRLQLERQYKDLNPSVLTVGKKYVSDVISESGKQVAKQYVTDAIGTGVKILINKFPKKK